VREKNRQLLLLAIDEGVQVAGRRYFTRVAW
jgi:hypothetical protein